MQHLQISAPKWVSTDDIQSWNATYQITAADNVRILAIESRSAIDVVIAKMIDYSPIFGVYTKYYVSSPILASQFHGSARWKIPTGSPSA